MSNSGFSPTIIYNYITPSAGLSLTSGTAALAVTGVTAGTYGDSTHAVQLTINANGYITVASNSTLTATAQSNGWKNRFINGGMQIAQNNNVVLPVSTVTRGGCDRFVHVTGGAAGGLVTNSGTLSQAAVSWSSSGYAQKIGNFTTGTATDTLYIMQRIEQANISDLNGKTVVVSGKFFQDTGATVSSINIEFAYLSGGVGQTLDDWSSLFGTFTSMGSFSAASGTAVSFSGTTTLGTADANYGLGMFLIIPVAANVTAKNYYIADLQLEVGTAATALEMRPVGMELQLCQRYLPAYNHIGGGSSVRGQITTATNARITYPFTVPARIAPTGILAGTTANFVVYGNAAGGNIPTAVSFSAASTIAADVNFTVTSDTTIVAGNATLLTGAGATTVKMLFTGCEL